MLPATALAPNPTQPNPPNTHRTTPQWFPFFPARSNSPGGVNFESAPFKLTRELLEVLDSDSEGRASEPFDYFKVGWRLPPGRLGAGLAAPPPRLGGMMMGGVLRMPRLPVMHAPPYCCPEQPISLVC